MRRTILQEINPISVNAVFSIAARLPKKMVFHAVKDVIRQTQPVFPKIHRRARTVRFQTYPLATVVGLALSIGTTGILMPQKGRANAAEPVINLTKLDSTTVLSPVLPAANTIENSIQPSKTIAKPLWVPKQAHVDEPVQSPVAHIDEALTVAYLVQPKDTVETIASNYQIPERELVKVNRLNNPNVIRVDQVLRIPSAQVESNYAIGGDGSTPATTPSVITAAQPSGVTLPPLTSQTKNIPISIAQTNSDAKFRVATVVANRPQAPVSPADRLRPRVSLRNSAQRVSESEAIQATSLGNQVETTAGTAITAISSQRQIADLQSDIQKLQAKYPTEDIRQNELQTATAPRVITTIHSSGVTLPAAPANQPGNVAVPAIPVSERRRNQTEVLRSNGQRLPGKYWIGKAKDQEIAQATVALTPKQKPVATVSARPNSYTSIIKRTVFPQLLNPELPPLSSVDTYLPNESLAGSQRYIWPTKGVLTSGFGKRWGRMHRGIDVAAPIGTPIVSAAVGVVVSAGWNFGGYGNLVNILHPDGSLTRYAHNKRLLVRPGQAVGQGQQIAEMGSTGRSTGPHLHFEIRPPGKGAVNPMFYLSRS